MRRVDGGTCGCQIRVVVGVEVALFLSVMGDRGWLGSSEMSGIAAGAAHRDDEDKWVSVVDFRGADSFSASSCAKAQNLRHNQQRLHHLL